MMFSENRADLLINLLEWKRRFLVFVLIKILNSFLGAPPINELNCFLNTCSDLGVWVFYWDTLGLFGSRDKEPAVVKQKLTFKHFSCVYSLIMAIYTAILHWNIIQAYFNLVIIFNMWKVSIKHTLFKNRFC